MHTAASVSSPRLALRRLAQVAVASLALGGAAVGLSGCCCNPLGFLGVAQVQSGPTEGAVAPQVRPGAATLEAIRSY